MTTMLSLLLAFFLSLLPHPPRQQARIPGPGGAVTGGGGGGSLTVVHSTGVTCTFSTTCPVTLSAAPVAGNALVVIYVSTGPGLLVGVTHGTDAAYANDHNISNLTVQYWSNPNISSTSTSMTINLNAGADSGVAVILEISGGLSSAWFDQSQDNEQFGTTGYTSNATATLAQTNEIAIGAHNNRSTAAGTWTPSGGFVTQFTQSALSTQLSVQTLVVSATTGIASAGTHSTSVNIENSVATYKGH